MNQAKKKKGGRGGVNSFGTNHASISVNCSGTRLFYGVMVRAAAICVAAPLRGRNRNIWLWVSSCPGSRPVAVLQETTGWDRLTVWHRGAGYQLLTFAVSYWPVMLTAFLEEKLNLGTDR